MTDAESDLRRLIAECCHRYDDGDAAAFAALFATDNSVIDTAPDGGSARAWSDFLAPGKEAGGSTIVHAGRYHDRSVRDPDRRRFRTRTIVVLGDPVPDGA